MEEMVEDVLIDLNRIYQKLVELVRQLNAETSTGITPLSLEFQNIAQRLSFDTGNLEKLREALFAEGSQLDEIESENLSVPKTSTKQLAVEPIAGTREKNDVGPIDAAFSILDSLMWTHPRYPKTAEEAAKSVEDILSSAANQESPALINEIIVTNDEYERDAVPSQETIDTIEQSREQISTVKSNSYANNSSSDSFSRNQTISNLSPPSKYIRRQKMLESVLIKLKQLDRKLLEMVPGERACTVERLPEMSPSRTKTLQGHKAAFDPIESKKSKNAVSTKTSDKSTNMSYNHTTQKQNRKYLQTKRTSRSPHTTQTVDETSQTDADIQHATSTRSRSGGNNDLDANGWKEKANLVLSALVEYDVRNTSFVANEVGRLPSPTQTTLPYWGEGGYWATMANEMFKSLLKQRKCNAIVWNTLTQHSTLETALDHLRKKRN